MTRTTEGAPRRRGMTVGIVLVAIWMSLSLAYTWVILGFGSLYVCQGPGEGEACSDSYDTWWGNLLILHFLVIGATILLWRLPRARIWALLLGFLGTGVTAIAFTMLWRVDL